MTQRIALFGDTFGVPLTLKVISADMIAVCVAAEIRPHQHAELRRLCETYQIPFRIQPRISSESYPAFVQGLRALDLDLILSNCYSMLIRPEILSIPRLGAVNIHGALLPQYRGCNPIQWALLNNETETGATMHYMAAEFDAGDIIAQRRVPMHIQDTWRDVLARIGEATEEMLKEEVPRILTQTNNRQPQDETKACYYKRRQPEDGFIDWKQWSVIHVYNLVRALVKPHPGAFYYRASEKVVVDGYLTVPKVTALKYGEAGCQTLNTERIRIAPLSLADLPFAVQMIKRPSGLSFSTSSINLADEVGNRGWYESIHERNDLVVFGVRLLETDQLIGVGMLCSINFPQRTAELQVRFEEESATGSDYGIQARSLLLRFAYHELNLNHLYVHVVSTNEAAISACEKVGFLREGLLSKAAHIDGEYVDLVVMGLSREDFGG
mgnify:CR=1 FL=1